jgi:hypothetical protein
MREWRVIEGVAALMKDSGFMPRLEEYQAEVVGMERTVRTRWSRDVIFAEGVVVVEAIPLASTCEPFTTGIGVLQRISILVGEWERRWMWRGIKGGKLGVHV